MRLAVLGFSQSAHFVLPKRAALVGAAAYGAAVFAAFTLAGHGWLLCVALAAAGSALYTPTCHAAGRIVRSRDALVARRWGAAVKMR
jgi:hypothetical protein